MTMTVTKLRALDRLDGEKQREEGRAAYRRHFKLPSHATNPNIAGSFKAYCWNAGFQQDVRSIEQLQRAWELGR